MQFEGDYKIKSLDLAEYGRLEIEMSELEMPGLMKIREKYGPSQPLKGKRISGSLHMTIQTAVLIETLVALGAEVRWCSCNIFSTQDHAAAAIVADKKAAVFAWKNETLEEYWDLTLKAATWGEQGPTSIVDDGGDMTVMFIEGIKWGEKYKNNKELPDPSKAENDDEKYLLQMIAREVQKDPDMFARLAKDLQGVSEETTTGVMRLNQMSERGELPFVAVNINDSVTKSKFDNIYGCRQSVIDGVVRATDVMISGKKVLVCGYGDVGKGCAQAFRNNAAQVFVSEIDPICALQACMEGFKVVRLDSVVKDIDIFITATGNKNIIMAADMQKMKKNAIVGNIGHFDNEIDMRGLNNIPGVKRINVKPQTDIYRFPNGNQIIILAEGRLLNLGCATGHPSFVMSNSFTNQTLAQLSIYDASNKYEKGKVYLLPKKLDEEVARLHLESLGAELEVLTEEKSKYLGIPIEGPFKSNTYRY